MLNQQESTEMTIMRTDGRWTAQLFTWGSVCWVLNGQFLFFPGEGSTNFDFYFTGYTALAGGTLFWVGAYFSVVEALNVGQQVRLVHARAMPSQGSSAAGLSTIQRVQCDTPAL